MGKELLHQNRVLCLSNSWNPLRVTTPEQSFVAMSRIKQKHYSEDKKRPYFAIDFQYFQNEDLSYNFDNVISIIPVEWEEWVNLPIRSFDKVIRTSSREIRVPTVIIANNCRHIPKVISKYSKHAVWVRDNSTCQYTGEKVTRATGSLDHYYPKSKGGKTTFENTLLVTKEINSKKGDLMPEEFEKKYGYKLLKPLVQPKQNERVIINHFEIPDWNLFIK